MGFSTALLGIRNLIFDKLQPTPQNGVGAWPASIERWVNIADRGDIVALVKNLALRFGSQVEDRHTNNGMTAHDIRRYLTAEVTGRAIVAGLAN